MHKRLGITLVLLTITWAAAAQLRCSVLGLPNVEPSPAIPPSSILQDPVVIPVAVHIVWNTPEENISDQQVASQLEVLNQDFRSLNIEIPEVHPLFDELASDLEIEFCLVATTRTPTPFAGITNLFSGGRRRLCHSDLGGRDGFSPDHYLNIWVAGRNDGALGSATFPEEGLANPAEDGLYIRPDAFGTTGTVSPPFDLGRTCTHELGHYFNLQHLWGPGEDNFSCTADDGIVDTPLQAFTYQGTCPTLPPLSCGSPDMFMNFMNFTEDACMALFTPGQKVRVMHTLLTFRQGLIDGSCMPVPTRFAEPDDSVDLYVLGNPVAQHIKISLPGNGRAYFAIFDTMGRLIEQGNAKGPIIELAARGIPNGSHFIKIRYDNKIFFKKLIIAR